MDHNDGPELTVNRILVSGAAGAAYKFVQPTYPGDPNGQDDPDPRAHQAGQVVPVGGKDNNPLPPACTPEVTGNDVNAQNGDPCPANKLVITPPANIKNGHAVPSHGLLHRPAGRAHRRRRLDRGLVPQQQASGRRRLRHHRAGRHRGLDAAEQPSDARSRPTTSTTPSTPGSTAVANGMLLLHHAQRARRALPRRIDHLSLALAGPDRELPGREQRRQLRPDLPRR